MTDPVRHTIAMSAPPDDVNTVHALLVEVWADAPAVSTMDRVCFETALIELASNVISHAGDGSGIQCLLTVDVFNDHVEARLSDSGEPGDLQLTPRAMPDELSESGRGIPLIQALVNEVEYAREGSLNQWRISRNFRS